MSKLMKIFKGDCRAIEGDMWDYAERRLGEDRLERVERHLAICAKCRIEVVAFQAAATALTEVREEVVPAPRTGWRELERRIVFEQENAIPKLTDSRSGSRFSKLSSALVPASSMMTLALLGVLVYQTRRPAAVSVDPIVKTQNKAGAVATVRPSATPSEAPNDVEFDKMMDSSKGFTPVSLQEVSYVRGAGNQEEDVPKPISAHHSAVIVKHPELVNAIKKAQEKKSNEVKTNTKPTDEGFKLHPHKPTSEERSHEQQGYVMGNITPVSNNDF